MAVGCLHVHGSDIDRLARRPEDDAGVRQYHGADDNQNDRRCS